MAEVKKKKKAFGGAGGKRAGTGKVDESVASNSAQTWIGSMSEQAEGLGGSKASGKKLLSKFVPTHLIICDEHNPRRLAITGDQVKSIVDKHPLDKQWLEDGCDIDWRGEYIATVVSDFSLSSKAKEHFESILEAAISLQNAEQLTQLVEVIQTDATFHLVFGQRRWLAHLLLGEKHIGAVIKEPMERFEIAKRQWDENLSEDMPLPDKVDHVGVLYQYAAQAGHTSIRQFANVIGRGVAETQRYLAVINCKHPELLEAVRAEKVTSLKKAAKLAQLNKTELIAALKGDNPKPKRLNVKLAAKVNLTAVEAIITAAAAQLEIDNPAKGGIESAQQASEILDLLIAQVGEQSAS